MTLVATGRWLPIAGRVTPVDLSRAINARSTSTLGPPVRRVRDLQRIRLARPAQMRKWWQRYASHLGGHLRA